jgi:hypothetical protein
MRRGLAELDGGTGREGGGINGEWRYKRKDTEEGSVGEAERRGTKNIFPLAES